LQHANCTKAVHLAFAQMQNPFCMQICKTKNCKKFEPGIANFATETQPLQKNKRKQNCTTLATQQHTQHKHIISFAQRQKQRQRAAHKLQSSNKKAKKFAKQKIAKNQKTNTAKMGQQICTKLQKTTQLQPQKNPFWQQQCRAQKASKKNQHNFCIAFACKKLQKHAQTKKIPFQTHGNLQRPLQKIIAKKNKCIALQLQHVTTSLASKTKCAKQFWQKTNKQLHQSAAFAFLQQLGKEKKKLQCRNCNVQNKSNCIAKALASLKKIICHISTQKTRKTRAKKSFGTALAQHCNNKTLQKKIAKIVNKNKPKHHACIAFTFHCPKKEKKDTSKQTKHMAFAKLQQNICKFALAHKQICNCKTVNKAAKFHKKCKNFATASNLANAENRHCKQPLHNTKRERQRLPQKNKNQQKKKSCTKICQISHVANCKQQQMQAATKQGGNKKHKTNFTKQKFGQTFAKKKTAFAQFAAICIANKLQKLQCNAFATKQHLHQAETKCNKKGPNAHCMQTLQKKCKMAKPKHCKIAHPCNKAQQLQKKIMPRHNSLHLQKKHAIHLQHTKKLQGKTIANCKNICICKKKKTSCKKMPTIATANWHKFCKAQILQLANKKKKQKKNCKALPRKQNLQCIQNKKKQGKTLRTATKFALARKLAKSIANCTKAAANTNCPFKQKIILHKNTQTACLQNQNCHKKLGKCHQQGSNNWQSPKTKQIACIAQKHLQMHTCKLQSTKTSQATTARQKIASQHWQMAPKASNALQKSATNCNALQRASFFKSRAHKFGSMQKIALQCNQQQVCIIHLVKPNNCHCKSLQERKKCKKSNLQRTTFALAKLGKAKKKNKKKKKCKALHTCSSALHNKFAKICKTMHVKWAAMQAKTVHWPPQKTKIAKQPIVTNLQKKNCKQLHCNKKSRPAIAHPKIALPKKNKKKPNKLPGNALPQLQKAKAKLQNFIALANFKICKKKFAQKQEKNTNKQQLQNQLCQAAKTKKLQNCTKCQFALQQPTPNHFHKQPTNCKPTHKQFLQTNKKQNSAKRCNNMPLQNALHKICNNCKLQLQANSNCKTEKHAKICKHAKDNFAPKKQKKQNPLATATICKTKQMPTLAKTHWAISQRLPIHFQKSNWQKKQSPFAKQPNCKHKIAAQFALSEQNHNCKFAIAMQIAT